MGGHDDPATRGAPSGQRRWLLMNPGPVKSWLDRLLETAVVLVVIALLVNWAWSLIRSLIPIIVITTGLGLLVAMVVRHNRSW